MWTLYVGSATPPERQVSRRETHTESRKAWIAWMAWSRALSSMASTPFRMKLDVVSSFHTSLIMFRTRFGSMVRRSLMANMKVGSFIDGVVTRKVMLVEDQTICWMRIWRWTSLRL